MQRPLKIAPSLLAADFGHLANEVARVESHVDMLHLDVMDGHFVPNLSFGMPVIAALRPHTSLLFDVHVMATNPTDLVGPLSNAGADLITAHIEAVPDPSAFIEACARAGCRCGLAVSPPTPWAALEPYAEPLDLILVMSVHPGFGGQSFMPEVLGKVEMAAKWVESHGLAADIEIDGGIGPGTIARAASAGANTFVAGTAIFGAPDPVEAIRTMRMEVTG